MQVKMFGVPKPKATRVDADATTCQACAERDLGMVFEATRFDAARALTLDAVTLD